MPFWSWLFDTTPEAVAKPRPPQKRRISRPNTNQTMEFPCSPVCDKKSRLGDRESGYLEREKLQHALQEMFQAHGDRLEFGLHQRAERWYFWAPRKVEWIDLESYYYPIKK